MLLRFALALGKAGRQATRLQCAVCGVRRENVRVCVRVCGCAGVWVCGYVGMWVVRPLCVACGVWRVCMARWRNQPRPTGGGTCCSGRQRLVCTCGHTRAAMGVVGVVGVDVAQSR